MVLVCSKFHRFKWDLAPVIVSLTIYSQDQDQDQDQDQERAKQQWVTLLQFPMIHHPQLHRQTLHMLHTTTTTALYMVWVFSSMMLLLLPRPRLGQTPCFQMVVVAVPTHRAAAMVRISHGLLLALGRLT
jgi:hypothetical protein